MNLRLAGTLALQTLARRALGGERMDMRSAGL